MNRRPPASRGSSRRSFLGTAAALAAWPARWFTRLYSQQPAAGGELVNDIHSQLNATRVDRVVKPGTPGDLRTVLMAC